MLLISERAVQVHIVSLFSLMNTGSSTVYTLLLLGSRHGGKRKTMLHTWEREREREREREKKKKKKKKKKKRTCSHILYLQFLDLLGGIKYRVLLILTLSTHNTHLYTGHRDQDYRRSDSSTCWGRESSPWRWCHSWTTCPSRIF